MFVRYREVATRIGGRELVLVEAVTTHERNPFYILVETPDGGEVFSWVESDPHKLREQASSAIARYLEGVAK